MQPVTLGIGNAFGPVEMAIKETFVPGLFEGLGEGASEQGITCLSVKQAILDIPEPTLASPENRTATCVITGHLVAVLRVQVKFRTEDYSAYLREVRTAVWRQRKQRVEEALAATISGSLVKGAR